MSVFQDTFCIRNLKFDQSPKSIDDSKVNIAALVDRDWLIIRPRSSRVVVEKGSYLPQWSAIVVYEMTKL